MKEASASGALRPARAVLLLGLFAACGVPVNEGDGGARRDGAVDANGGGRDGAAGETSAPLDAQGGPEASPPEDVATAPVDTSVPLDVSTAPVDTSVPLDATAPPVDVMAPPVDTSVPRDTASPPPVDVVVPRDTASPPADAAAPVDAAPPPDGGTMPAACAAPSGVSASAAAALMLQNTLRTAMGVPCATMVPTINTAATRHCQYYAANRSTAMCVANPHVEVSGCGMYTAANFGERMRAAGYTGSPAMENMHFLNNGASAVQGWVDTVYHRTPVLNPWMRDMGYGAATGCDTMDVGAGAATPATLVASYPYANQTMVPTSFSGAEGPAPPAPPSGWPSGYPITLFVRGGSITTHTITVDGATEQLPHVWMPAGGLLQNAYVLYTHRPLTARTRYRVRATGMNSGGAVNFDFVFTTR